MVNQRMCVISLGINSPSPSGHPEVLFQDFPRGIARIKEALVKYKFHGDFIFWDKDYPEGCPIHRQTPWAFKPFCFYEVQKRGYELVLWLDASIKIKRPLEPLFELMRQDGHLIFQEDHTVGEYCKDEALKPLGITREESFGLPCCWSSVLGLDLNNQRSVEFLRQWDERASDGVTFPGPKWSGVFGWPKTASQDPRVKGHRHDQTAASVIALKLGMDQWKSRKFFDEFFDLERSFVRKFQEQKGDTVLKRCVRFGKKIIKKIILGFSKRH
jgi:hypothetical protein